MPTPESPGPPPVVGPLQALLADLQRLDRVRPGDSSSPPGLAVWRGDSWTYLEADLPGPGGPDVDVSVHQGKVFIRVGPRG